MHLILSLATKIFTLGLQNCNRLNNFMNIWHLSQDNLETGDFRKKRETGAILSKREPPVQNERIETYDGLYLAHSLLLTSYLYVIHQSNLKLTVHLN